MVVAVRATVRPRLRHLHRDARRFHPATAIELARELAPFHPGWIEEPVPPENLRALKKVAEAIHDIPIATGERLHTRYEYRELFELQACDIIQPDITHFGGLAETRRLASWAEAYYVLVAPHNVCGPVGTRRGCIWPGARPTSRSRSTSTIFDAGSSRVACAPEVVTDAFALPQVPAWGVTLTRNSSPLNRARRHVSTSTRTTGTGVGPMQQNRDAAAEATCSVGREPCCACCWRRREFEGAAAYQVQARAPSQACSGAGPTGQRRVGIAPAGTTPLGPQGGG